MSDFTGDAKKFLQNYIKKIKEAKTSSDIDQNEVAEDIHNDILEKIKEKKLSVITKDDIKKIIMEMGLSEINNEETDNTSEKSTTCQEKANWFKTPVNIFKYNFNRSTWLVLLVLFTPVSFGIFIGFNFLFIYILNTLAEASFSEIIGYIFVSINILFSLFYVFTILYVIARIFNLKYKAVIISTIIIAAVSFIIENLLGFEIFNPFTTGTVISLWTAFTVLFLTVFFKNLPKNILPVFSPFLISGFFLCLPFIIYLAPFMCISWCATVFLGLGLLPLSPLFAFLSFLYAYITIFNYIRKNSSKFIVNINMILSAVTIVSILSYFGWFLFQAYRCNETVKYFSNDETGHDRVYKDLPKWAKISMKIPVNHASKLHLLQSEQGFFFSLASNEIFSPWGFLSTLLAGNNNLNNDEIENIQNLMFDNYHSNIERLWRGHSIRTTIVDSHIQIYPESRIAYSEITLNVYNGNSDRSQQEAIFTVTLPPYSVASKLALWIDGIEQPARLTLKSKAKQAYKEIVGVERRDPSLLEWLDGNRLRLRVFPVLSKETRTVKIGIISPLKKENSNLYYVPVKFTGHPFNGTKHNVYVDIMSLKKSSKVEFENINLKEKVTSDNQIMQFNSSGKYKDRWKIKLTADKLNGSFIMDYMLYKTGEIKYTEKEFIPDCIYILLNSSCSKSQWKKIITEIFQSKDQKTKLYLVSAELFNSENLNKNLKFLENADLPAFNLFPIYLMDKTQKNLLVSSCEKHSMPLSSLKGSEFYKKIQTYISENKTDIYAATLNNKFSDYFDSLAQFNIAKKIATNSAEIISILNTKKVKLPDENNCSVFKESDFAINKEKTKNENNKIEGNGLLYRLYSYKEIMNKLGTRYFEADWNQTDLLAIANDAKIVSPVSSFIVLETVRDYDRFDIKDQKSKLDQTEKKKNTGLATDMGVVPEPEEWLLMIMVILTILFFNREKIKKLILRKAWK